ncbi:ASCH domain-containing protein [Thalassotalea sp. PLHSN55]|uniref:ASCH domain-containing protein n=1 Tax=Thalassotalea sp. PLHSN55 TaxID=3435888 RepID=UPI003F87C2A5
MHPSISKICDDYFKSLSLAVKQLNYWHFCDNEQDADECAELVLKGVKKATSPSLWWFKANNEALPKVGELNIVTRWNGEAVCIIETLSVSIEPFNEITAKYAELEGEGDKSLRYWQKVHWDYYHRELASTNFTPNKEMPIVCEVFKVVFKAKYDG